MKKNDIKPKPQDLNNLYNSFLALSSEQDVESFLYDLCTPIEIHAMSDRLLTARELSKKTPYYIISKENAISVATVSRVARFLKNGAGGYKLVLQKLKLHK